jgi:hypothetical protein
MPQLHLAVSKIKPIRPILQDPAQRPSPPSRQVRTRSVSLPRRLLSELSELARQDRALLSRPRCDCATHEVEDVTSPVLVTGRHPGHGLRHGTVRHTPAAAADCIVCNHGLHGLELSLSLSLSLSVRLCSCEEDRVGERERVPEDGFRRQIGRRRCAGSRLRPAAQSFPRRTSTESLARARAYGPDRMRPGPGRSGPGRAGIARGGAGRALSRVLVTGRHPRVPGPCQCSCVCITERPSLSWPKLR